MGLRQLKSPGRSDLERLESGENGASGLPPSSVSFVYLALRGAEFLQNLLHMVDVEAYVALCKDRYKIRKGRVLSHRRFLKGRDMGFACQLLVGKICYQPGDPLVF